MDRRIFVSGMAAMAATRLSGANDRLRVANVGCGRRGLLKELIQIKDGSNVEVAAVCDTWNKPLEAATAYVKEMTGKAPDATSRYADVLSRKDIDAVVIGTPDHLHCSMLIAAVEAGKDVYVEKPLAMNMAELNRAFDAVKKSGRIVQLGTQMRSYAQSNGLKKFLAEGGLGKVLKIEQVRNGYRPYWMSYGGDAAQSDMPKESDVDWKAFLGDRKSRPFDAQQYRNWYGYRDFSQGPQTNLMVHFIDLVHYVTPASIPTKAVALGGTYRWKEAYDVPDSVEVAYDYPEGFLVRYCTVFGNSAGNYARWQGTRGTVDAKNLSPSQRWIASPAGAGDPNKLTAEITIPEPETPHHMANFAECVRTRKQPVAPIEAGYNHSVAVLMADEALVTGRRVTFDAQRRRIIPG